MTDTKQDAYDKAQNGKMNDLLADIAESTGAFSEHANESLTVHIGGNTMEYIARSSSMSSNSPVLKIAKRSDYVDIKRIGIKKVRRNDELKTVPSITLEVSQ